MLQRISQHAVIMQRGGIIFVGPVPFVAPPPRIRSLSQLNDKNNSKSCGINAAVNIIRIPVGIIGARLFPSLYPFPRTSRTGTQ